MVKQPKDFFLIRIHYLDKVKRLENQWKMCIYLKISWLKMINKVWVLQLLKNYTEI